MCLKIAQYKVQFLGVEFIHIYVYFDCMYMNLL